MIARIKHKKKDFSILSNECLQDATLSARAKGLWAYMMTLPDNWKVHKDEVFNHFAEGRDAMRRAWKELTDAGYIVTDAVRDEQGKISAWETTVLEIRHQKAGNQTSGNPACGESDTTKDLFLLKTNKLKSTHPTLGVPINQTRYDSLCKEWTARTVDSYIQKAIDYVESRGKKQYADYAATAGVWLRKDEEAGKIKRPVLSTVLTAEQKRAIVREQDRRDGYV